ncbi:hypothetical protein JE952_000581 [Flavobacterium psychrophilum]|nr:hypothetical protein [Flavobacterium psychrophilum]
MEALFIYLIKVNSLIVIFYLAYTLLVQKETFFNTNRWFLLSGLFTSVLIPLFFIKKIVFIEAPKFASTKFASIKNATINPIIEIEESINWHNMLLLAYSFISIILLLKIASELISFFKLIKNKKRTINKPFTMVDINENINPFSFFKYIVFNSAKYSDSELDNILNHEKVHSKEKHSADILIAKVFCTFFWFNPFVWLYKKAIIQNLEYIADQKAIQNIEDKKAYQMTLLKVVTDHNCLSITNSFYQSLIKKRIVMLNKNQSKQKKIWKYALVIPALVAFVIFFQVKVIAQEKLENGTLTTLRTDGITEMIIDKNSTDSDIKKDCDALKKVFNVDLKVTIIKRNKKGEITAISITANDHKGSTSTHDVTSDQAITPFKFSMRRDLNGKGEFRFYDETDTSKYETIAKEENNSDEYPTPPTPPDGPDMSNMPSPPAAPNFPPPPTVRFPKNPNDKKAIKKYEAEMEKYSTNWESTEIKKYEADMAAYEKAIEAYQPDMTEYEAKMEKYEMEMEAYQEKINDYQEKIRDEKQDKLDASRDKIEIRKKILIKQKKR